VTVLPTTTSAHVIASIGRGKKHPRRRFGEPSSWTPLPAYREASLTARKSSITSFRQRALRRQPLWELISHSRTPSGISASKDVVCAGVLAGCERTRRGLLKAVRPFWGRRGTTKPGRSARYSGIQRGTQTPLAASARSRCSNSIVPGMLGRVRAWHASTSQTSRCGFRDLAVRPPNSHTRDSASDVGPEPALSERSEEGARPGCPCMHSVRVCRKKSRSNERIHPPQPRKSREVTICCVKHAHIRSSVQLIARR